MDGKLVIEKKIPILFNIEEECCGCSSCKSICPVGAIEMKIDRKGFEYPDINSEICIKCYQCLRVCPI
ncbi:MAG: Benzylsuccinate synthase activating enzyme [uncultured Clostridium sp.]